MENPKFLEKVLSFDLNWINIIRNFFFQKNKKILSYKMSSSGLSLKQQEILNKYKMIIMDVYNYSYIEIVAKTLKSFISFWNTMMLNTVFLRTTGGALRNSTNQNSS